ncbi:hypothetical protein J23TS9_48720 [Paenibacillus sp. J23TS9]|nr:hypothetical protein J23TS9_48720 [Paenibacillus sp. J23TS9]
MASSCLSAANRLPFSHMYGTDKYRSPKDIEAWSRANVPAQADFAVIDRGISCSCPVKSIYG